MPPTVKKAQPKAAPKEPKDDDLQEPVAPPESAAGDGAPEQADKQAQPAEVAQAHELADGLSDGLDESQEIDLLQYKQPEPRLEGADPKMSTPAAIKKHEEMICVMDPCPKCYPHGWYEGAAEGTIAGCRHVKVPFGKGLEISREKAIELGYGPKE